MHRMNNMKVLRLCRLLTEKPEPSNVNQHRTLPYLVASFETHYTKQRRFLQQTGSAVKSRVFVPVTSNLGMWTRGQCGQPFGCTNKRGHDKEWPLSDMEGWQEITPVTRVISRVQHWPLQVRGKYFVQHNVGVPNGRHNFPHLMRNRHTCETASLL